MQFSEILYEIVTEEERLLIAGAVLFGIIASVAHALSKTMVGLAREKTRREIAAYIAEGSMTPEQGERLLRGGSAKSCGI